MPTSTLLIVVGSWLAIAALTGAWLWFTRDADGDES